MPKNPVDLIKLRDGMFPEHSFVYSQGDELRFVAHVVEIGDVHLVHRGQSEAIRKRHHSNPMKGLGIEKTEIEAFLPALGEALERYSTCAFSSEQFVFASAEELGRDALDLELIPKLSKAELLHPRCPFGEPNKRAPIRWVRSISLLDNRVVYLPAVMVYLGVGITPAERFCMPITTGCAAHTSLERALLGAICEVVERDAISLTWLQKLPLPRIDVDCMPPQLASDWDIYERSANSVEYRFFDGTSEIGIPTVYGVSIAPSNLQSATLVACSSALNAPKALAKVFRELFQIRLGFRKPRSIPASWDDFTDFFHGATYMARAENQRAFDFLLRENHRRRLSEIKPIGNDVESESLAAVLSLLRKCGMDVYAVDLSTDESLRAGFWVVRAIIPALQPLGFFYRARYLGHPRLYEAPARMGYPVHHEAQLNHWPQPFA